MDKIEEYKKIIKNILAEYAETRKPDATNEVQHQLLFDDQHNHFQLFCVGWKGLKRIYFPVFHLDIQKDKIWVQEDATDFDLVGELEAHGIPKSDIVLAFHAPYKRQFTEYAVA